MTQTSAPDSNPKTAFGLAKPSFHYIPPVAEMVLGQAMQNGGEKYGAMNWRQDTVSSTVYYDAARRHLSAWLDGEDLAPDSRIHHLGHVMACCAIILDAQAQGTLNDNRPAAGMFAAEALKVVKDGKPDDQCNYGWYSGGAGGEYEYSLDGGCVAAVPDRYEIKAKPDQFGTIVYTSAGGFELGDLVAIDVRPTHTFTIDRLSPTRAEGNCVCGARANIEFARLTRVTG